MQVPIRWILSDHKAIAIMVQYYLLYLHGLTKCIIKHLHQIRKFTAIQLSYPYQDKMHYSYLVIHDSTNLAIINSCYNFSCVTVKLQLPIDHQLAIIIRLIQLSQQQATSDYLHSTLTASLPDIITYSSSSYEDYYTTCHTDTVTATGQCS